MGINQRWSGEGAIRAFVAVPLPEEARSCVEGVQRRLRGFAGVKWVEPENFHVTLRFLGNSPPELVQRLAQTLLRTLSDQKAFSLTLAGVGAFPSARRPQAIWVGVSEGKSRLEELARITEESAVASGFAPEERPFRAHLTIGRVKASPAPSGLSAAIMAEAEGAEIATITVENVVLMQSELRRSGPIYTPIECFPLARE